MHETAMSITVNGKTVSVPSGATIRTVLDVVGVGNATVAVERNGEIVPRATHATVEVVDADRIEIVHFVGGG